MGMCADLKAHRELYWGGRDKDTQKAVALYEESAQANGYAMNALGDCYQHGHGQNKNRRKAF